MGQFAWVTLATNDSYALGALVVGHSLKKVNTVHQLAVLVTPGVTPSMREKLQTVFNVVQEVNVLDSKDAANLALLSRPELGITFTKLHCWRLTQYEKCVFLDADTLVLQNCDELFEREELSAAPDVGWPDCFNSGVYVYRPSVETFEKLTQFAVQKGSFDGGDQGLLNSFFSDWAHKDISKRLPFIYNTCSTACYSYLPAFKQFGDNVKILHFIGQLKPWLINFDPCTKKVNPPQEYRHLSEVLDIWWSIFCQDVHGKLSPDMSGLAGALANLKLGSPRTAEQEAYENSARRQHWEHGHIDYLGKDSFDNIWKRITQTLESKNESAAPSESQRRARTPTPQPEDNVPKETKKEGTPPKSIETQEQTTDAQTVQKKVVTIPGEETVEVEQWESTQVGDKKTEKHSKTVTSQPVSQPAQVPADAPAQESEKQESVKSAESEKTTTVSTTVTGDGKTKVETKTVYAPVVTEGDEEEEEEIYEETETYTSGPVKATTTSTDDGSVTQVVSKSAAVEQKPPTADTTEKSPVTTAKTTAPEPKVITSVAQSAVTDPKTTVTKQKLPSGEEVEIHTTLSADGKTKTQKKIVKQPDEEIEIEESEETYEPAVVTKTTTTTTTAPKSVAKTESQKQPVAAAPGKGKAASKTETPKVTIPEKKDQPKKTPKTPTVTSATPPTSPPSSGASASSPKTEGLKAEHEIPDTPPISKGATTGKKPVASPSTTSTTSAPTSAPTAAPVAPARKKDAKKPAKGK